MTDTTETITGLYLEELDPQTLVMDANVRTGAEGSVDDRFIASLKASKGMLAPASGNLIPILVKRLPDGRLRVFDGARRTIGCARAGLKVAGIITGDEGDDQADRRARILGQLLADDREKLPLTDRTAAMLTLFDDEGMTVAGIAKAMGAPKGTVETALAVARSELATRAVQRWNYLTLDQAAVLAEFGGDTEALTELTRAAEENPGQFEHVAQRCRDSAAERAQKAALTAELEAAGYQVAGDYRGMTGWHNLRNWLAADGTGLTLENHDACEYRAVRIEQELVWPAEAEAAWRADPANAGYLEQIREDDGLGPDDVVPVEFDSDQDAADAGQVPRWTVSQGYCTDPAAAGHKDRYPAGTLGSSSRAKPEPGTAEAEQAKEERRRLLASNRAWRSATEVRRAHLKSLLSRKSLTPRTLAEAAFAHVLDAMTRGETEPEKTGDGHSLAAQLLGLTGEKYAAGRELIRAAAAGAAPALPGRRLVLALAIVLAGAEGEDGTFGACADVHTWQRADGKTAGYGYRSGPGRAARHLAFLETHTGYVLSGLEARVVHGEPGPGETAGTAVEVAPPAGEIDAGDGAPDPGEPEPPQTAPEPDPRQSPQDAPGNPVPASGTPFQATPGTTDQDQGDM